MKFEGIFPALLTPFDKTDSVNTKALTKLIEYNISKGVNGFYVGGSTSEAFMLSDTERNLVYETCAKAVSGRASMIAHVGCISTKQAIGFAKTAKALGYDAISAVAPFYYKFSFEQIRKYYYDIVEAVDLPMIVYNFPSFSGVTLTVGQVSEFLSDDRFIGIKHTSSDYFALGQIKMKFPNKSVFNGFDEMFVCGLAMGADGAIGSTFNFMAEKFIAIRKLVSENRNAEALAVQQEANRIISALCQVGVFEGEKEVLCQMGFDFGNARAPFSCLTDEQKAFVKSNITDTL